MGFIKNQLLNVVEWNEDREGILFWKWDNNEIKKGSKLIIRPGQDAIFLHNGAIEGVFEDDGEYLFSFCFFCNFFGCFFCNFFLCYFFGCFFCNFFAAFFCTAFFCNFLCNFFGCFFCSFFLYGHCYFSCVKIYTSQNNNIKKF